MIPAVLASQPPYQGGFVGWATNLVEDVKFADWVRQIQESGDGKLSPYTVLALAFLVCKRADNEVNGRAES